MSVYGLGVDAFILIWYSKERNHLMKDSSKQDNRIQGEVIETLPSLQFRVKLEDGREIIAYLSGKLVIHRIRILSGDKVTVEMSPYDEKRGRIVFRGK